MPHDPQPLDLDAIDAVTAAATPGSWEVELEQCDCSDGLCSHGTYVAAVYANGERRNEFVDFSDADWQFVIRARTAMPAMAGEIRRLRAELATAHEQAARTDRQFDQVLRERDDLHDIADKLAYAVAPEEIIGEHSSMNDPWENALDLITPMAEVDKLRVQIATARSEAFREAAEALYAQAQRLAGEYNDSDILHEDGPAATVATWKRAAEKVRALPAAVETHVVADDSDDPEHIDDCPGCEDTLPAWLAQRFDPRSPDWEQLSDDDRAYWEHHARAVRRAVARNGFKATQAGADDEGLSGPCDCGEGAVHYTDADCPAARP
jgi:hypothetical protein